MFRKEARVIHLDESPVLRVINLANQFVGWANQTATQPTSLIPKPLRIIDEILLSLQVREIPIF